MDRYTQWLELEEDRISNKPSTIYSDADHEYDSGFDGHVSFEYDVLGAGEIRLLKILPAVDDQPLECVLETHKLWDNPERPQFVAVSYTWNRTPATKLMYLNGQAIDVGANCWYALWQARHNLMEHHHWVDSLCINQSDAVEKNAQVDMMGLIFSMATRVIACIGEHDDESRFLVNRLHEFRAQWATTVTPNNTYDSSQEFYRYMMVLLDPLHIPDDFVKIAMATCRLMERRYWQRTWIVQELTLARWCNVLIEDDWILLETLQSLVWCLRSISKGRSGFNALNNLTLDSAGDGQHEWKRRRPLLQLVSDHKYTKCRYDVDHVYALLALAHQAPGFEIKADYTITEFDLALKVLDMPENRYENIDMFQVEDMLRALQICSSYPTIKEMMHKRWAKQLEGSSLLVGPTLRAEHQVNDVFLRQQYRAVPISCDPGGRLVLPRALARDTQFAHDHSSDFEQMFAEYVRDIAQSSLTDKPAKPIYVLGNVEVLACHATKSQDLLLIWDERGPDLSMIIRRFDGDHYEIVGQAVINQGLQAQWSYTKKDWLDEDVYEVYFSKADLVLFLSRGISYQRGARDNATAFHELQLHFSRLRSAVVGNIFSSVVVRKDGPSMTSEMSHERWRPRLK